MAEDCSRCKERQQERTKGAVAHGAAQLRLSCHVFLAEREYVTFRSLLSQIRLSVVCNVRVPFSDVCIFGNISSSFCTLAILRPPCKILQRSSQENPSVGDLKRKKSCKIERCRVRESHLLMSFLFIMGRVGTGSKVREHVKHGVNYNIQQCKSIQLMTG